MPIEDEDGPAWALLLVLACMVAIGIGTCVIGCVAY